MNSPLTVLTEVGRAVARGERGVEAEHGLLGIVSGIHGARRRRKREEGNQQRSPAEGPTAQASCLSK